MGCLMVVFYKLGSKLNSISEKIRVNFMIFFIVFSFPSWGMEAPEQNEQQPVAKIFRQGKGEINIGGPWPEGHHLKRPSAYQVKRLPDKLIPNYSHHVFESWGPANFTSLKYYKEGQNLSSFKLVVHGLELKHLVQGLNDMSFDDFVCKYLNSEVPLGDEFIPYYPYFFHKKTIISASVICENLTATFGNAGFVLTVPSQNYLFGSNVDIHTPTDKDFYIKFNDEESLGEFTISSFTPRYPLPRLDTLLPQNNVTTSKGAYLTTHSYATIEDSNADDNITEEEIRHDLRRMGIHNPNPQQVKRCLERARQDRGKNSHMLNLISGKTQRNSDGSFEKAEKKSVYNEVAINPARTLKNRQLLTPSITGVFLRTSENELSQFLEKTYVKKLIQIAEAFDLPIILIKDNKTYETNL